MNKFKYTTIGQMLDVLKTHAINALIFSLIWVAFIAVWTNSVGAYVYAFIAMISYFFAIYGCGERAAKNDKKPYVSREASLKRSLYIPALLLAVNLFFIGLFKLTWVLGSNGETIQKMWSVVTNLLSYAWFSPFGTVAGMGKGDFSILGIALIVIVPEISYFLGYFAGMKGFDIADIFMRFVYEKKK